LKENGMSSGVGYVIFANKEEADRALKIQNEFSYLKLD